MLLSRILVASGSSPAERPPNVVLIVADDLGWNDVGYHGSEIRTPVLDRLVRESVQLDRHYVYPSCSPTRTCILSGRNAARFGIPGPIGITNDDRALPLETVTLAELLKERGYRTGLVGKWHLGNRDALGPRAQGFETYYGYLHGQVDQFTHLSWDGDPIWKRNEQTIDEDGHATDLFARESVAFIRKNRGGPFFLCLAFSVPHYPVQDTPEWVARYEKEIADGDRRVYAAMVSHMDDAIGRVLVALDQAGAREQTLVLFTSDNGGQRDWLNTRYGGRHGPYRRLGDNRPLRGWKTELYEGGVRVVALAHWRGRLKPRVLEEVTHACDVFPTVARLTGPPLAALVTAPEPLKPDGKDIWDVLRGEAGSGPRTFHWNIGSHVGIRDGNHKLIRRTRGMPRPGEEPVELYNLATDPYESKNLAASEKETVARLEVRLAEELRRDAARP